MNYNDVILLNNVERITERYYIEYDEFIHNLLSRMWDNMYDDEYIKMTKRILLNFSCCTDLTGYLYFFMFVLIEVFNKTENDFINIVSYNYNRLLDLWEMV